MARYDNAARDYMAEPVRPQPSQEPSRSFEVVEGRGLDARVRQGVSAEFLNKLKVVLLVGLLGLCIGLVRVRMAAATVSSLQSVISLRSDIEEAQSLEDELRAERSVLSSSSRIERIATQNYGMSLATETATVTLDSEEDADAADAASADDAADAEATDAAGTSGTSTEGSDGAAADPSGAACDAMADGDAAQPMAETGSANPEA